MNIQDIYQYFQSPPPTYLDQEVAICCVLSVLVEHGDSYGTALTQHIKAEHPPYQISDKTLYSALEFLLDEGLIQSYRHKAPGKGRPRRMFSITSERRDDTKRLAQLWQQFLRTDQRAATAKPS